MSLLEILHVLVGTLSVFVETLSVFVEILSVFVEILSAYAVLLFLKVIFVSATQAAFEMTVLLFWARCMKEKCI